MERDIPLLRAGETEKDGGGKRTLQKSCIDGARPSSLSLIDKFWGKLPGKNGHFFLPSCQRILKNKDNDDHQGKLATIATFLWQHA